MLYIFCCCECNAFELGFCNDLQQDTFHKDVDSTNLTHTHEDSYKSKHFMF